MKNLRCECFTKNESTVSACRNFTGSTGIGGRNHSENLLHRSEVIAKERRARARASGWSGYFVH